MNDTVMTKPQFDRTVEDLGNIVELGPRQRHGARPDEGDRLLPDGPRPDARSVPDGRPREHVGQRRPRPVPSADARPPQVVRGTTGLVVPDLEALLKRLEYAKKFLEGTQVQLQAGRQRRRNDLPVGQPHPHARTRSPRISARCASACRMSSSTLPVGTELDKIAQFYTEILDGIAGVSKRRARAVCLGKHLGRQQGDLPRERPEAWPSTTATTSRSRSPTSPARTRSWWSAA